MVSISQSVQPWLDRPIAAASPPQATSSPDTTDKGFHPFGDDGFSFLDLIDVVNPLHHIPVVGPIYREITGDVIGVLPRITGSTLFFGPIGAGLATADVVLEETTGKDAGKHILAMLRDLAPIHTAETPSAQTANPSSSDPIDTWLQAETNYHKQSAAAHEPNTAAPKPDFPTPLPTARVADPVLAWAQAENAYRAGLAARQSASAAPTSPRPNLSDGVDVALGALVNCDDVRAAGSSQKTRTILS